jgi:hypothetical protein
MFENIEAFYNRNRRHSTLGMLPHTPTNNSNSIRTTVEIDPPRNNKTDQPGLRKPGHVHRTELVPG